ncbi:hypothetical protein BV22DRAFT_1196412 [Leucogyrophana mollusca]|uniref:Uncharacterized protein n=1 Tax=Leucogyrophana mollusca TaxID=85980 RepID=A0ACB8BEP0_9AGAM|nr:hypothetical protein BV22DRAFT_1196412 [Leucogyrophana mollusca]
MGQTASRTRRQDARRSATLPSAPVSQPRSNDPTIDRIDSLPDRVEEGPSTSNTATKRSRRASMPKRLLEAIHTRPSGSARARTESAVSAATVQSQSSRRRWRLSRRWSKAPEELPTPDAPADIAPAVDEDAEEDADADSPQPSDLSAASKGKMREPQVGDDSRSNDVETPSDPPPPPTIITRPPSAPPETSLDATARRPVDTSDVSPNRSYTDVRDPARALAQRLGLVPPPSTDEDEVVIQPSTDSPNLATMAEHAAPPITPAAQAPGRQFPPPGTLVVVQGVVHTTDVSRTPEATAAPPRASSVPPPAFSRRRASSTPRPSTPAEERNSVRNRLSAFVPRPASMLPAYPSTSTPAADSSSQATSTTNTDSGDTQSSTEAGLTTEASTPSSTPQADSATAAAGSGSDPNSSSLSPSSIDVLGTLLSVAAAATAASLLTGSSEPIFSSGLAPPTAGAGPHLGASGAFHSADRPLSPTPTAGLGVGSVGFAGLGAADAASANPRDRMRQVWSSLRDRLGLRGPGVPGARNEEGDLGVRMRPDGTPMDAREIMLAEMARAFNLGLGLNNGPAPAAGDSGSNPVSAAAPSTGSQEGRATGSQPNNEAAAPSLPPPDSFERFLIDLQADLRIALTQEAPPAEPTQHSTAQDAGTSTTQLPTDIIPVPAPDHEVASIASGAYDTAAEDIDDDELPALASTSDSEEEDAEEDDFLDEEEGDSDPITREAPAPHAPHDGGSLGSTGLPAFTAGSTSRTEHRPGGGINWWRMYRFPAIASPQVPGHQNGVTAANPAMPAFMNNPTPSTTTPGLTATRPTSPEATPSDQRPNVVVPVIVVGLQSVNTGQRAPGQGQPGDAGDGADEADPMDFDGWNTPEDPNEPLQNPHDRRWRSRATNAFRNLRRGRRVSRQPTPDAPGSRTFMIYVIGGYYPPDHQIITAGDLESFEALWELAELLGQVKPPTASKEEIDRSGLEIIKASSLQQYEQENKIASNCVDRCLICLDDYAVEEDIRVLGCRHAFHKTCVDRWLQTGRNNCPACRSKGVGSEVGASHSMQTPASA